jgi:hypothetical protein
VVFGIQLLVFENHFSGKDPVDTKIVIAPRVDISEYT